jgi:hypothetical protein
MKGTSMMQESDNLLKIKPQKILKKSPSWIQAPNFNGKNKEVSV